MSDPDDASPRAAMSPEVAPHPLVSGLAWDEVTSEATELLARYVRIDSAHPRGRTVDTATFIADVLASEGIPSRIYPTEDPNKVNLVARVRAGRPEGKPVLLSNHMDVVQAVAADWTFDPFGGEVEHGYVRGRGALDMKGMGVMEIMAMLALRRLDVELTRDVVIMCTSDEETGSTLGAKLMVDHHFDDLDPGFVLDEGGSGMRGFFGAGDVFAVSVGEKRILWMKMIARAEPGHASAPWDEAATHRLVRAARAILAQPPDDRDSPPVAEMVKRLGGQCARVEIQSYRATAPLLHDTISLTMMSGGYKINVIPEQAEMSLDCRLLPDTDEQAFVSRLEETVGDPGVRFDVTWPNAAAATAPWDGAPFSAIEQACRAHLPAAIVTPSLFVAGTDARFFRQRGIPAYGLIPCVFTAADLKGYHGVDEQLSVENVELGTKIVLDLVGRLATRS